MKRKKKETLEERVKELEAMVRWLDYRVDKRLERQPIYYFYTYPNTGTGTLTPDQLKGWQAS